MLLLQGRGGELGISWAESNCGEKVKSPTVPNTGTMGHPKFKIAQSLGHPPRMVRNASVSASRRVAAPLAFSCAEILKTGAYHPHAAVPRG